MNKPKMVIFDAGKTLVDYLDIDTRCGVCAYSKYLIQNPDNMTVEEIDQEVNATFEDFELCRKQRFEVHEQTVLKLAFDRLGLKFSVSIPEIERMIWENDSNIVPVDGMTALLDYLNSVGIRTAVISNLDFSGYLLEESLKQIYPNNQFEFVLASSDYGIRKPDGKLFEVGIMRSGLAPEEIWYVGDKVKVDVVGAQTCGMVPVLYKSKYNNYEKIPSDIISVNHFGQLIDMLKA